MAVKIFLDANILLDFILKRGAHSDAEKVLSLVTKNKARGFITTSILHITAYWTTKAYGVEQTKRILISLLDTITIIDAPHDTALIALNSKINDIEDALQYYAAIHHKLDYFISRDEQLKKDCISILPVVAPGEFVTAYF